MEWVEESVWKKSKWLSAKTKRVYNTGETSYIHVRRWGDKTSYLKDVKCSGEPKTYM